NEVLGGLMTLGIPTYKLEKTIIERRLVILEKEGIKFKTKVNVGVNVSVDELKKKFDALVLCGGAEQPRDLRVEGRDLKGVYFAMDYLTQQTRVNLGLKIDKENRIDAKGKKVVILGGGDTGSDCIGTANRQGAVAVTQFELLPEPPKERDPDNPWPQWAFVRRVSTSQEEGCDVQYCVMTKNFIGEGGKIKKLRAVRVDFGSKDPETGRSPMKEVEGSEFEIDCDYVFLAMGFLGPFKEGMIKELGVALDVRGNIKTDITYMSSIEGVFSAGDMRTGQSLVVRAIDEGRNAALSVHKWLSK
ncbi:MAG: glutamate synthase subunit beta, partial [Candidatus Omnitrophica bacterium]|nr:glutamate synthase subunit beta [Candidatus Omnitrophota bacterium]